MAHDDPMTEKQSSYLESLCRTHGVDFDPDLSVREASEQIEELKDTLPDERPAAFMVSAAQVRHVACPACGASAGSRCKEETGQPRKRFHQERVTVARAAGKEWRDAQSE